MSSPQDPEEPLLGEVVVFYNHAFHLGGPIDPTQAARVILKQDFARTFANTLTEQIEIATKTQSVVQRRDDLVELTEFYKKLAEGVRIHRAVWGIRKFLLRHPVHASALAWELLRAYGGIALDIARSEVVITWSENRTIRIPWWLWRERKPKPIPNASPSLDPKQEDGMDLDPASESSVSDTTHTSPPYEQKKIVIAFSRTITLRLWPRRKSNVEDGSLTEGLSPAVGAEPADATDIDGTEVRAPASELPDSESELEKQISELEHHLVGDILIPSLRMHSDLKLFSEFYAGEAPFSRLELETFSGSIRGEEKTVEVFLLLHRSGVAILTALVPYDAAMSVNELLHVQSAGAVEIANLEIVKTLTDDWLESYGISSNVPPKHVRIHSGTEWMSWEGLEGVTLGNVLHAYEEGVRQALKRLLPDARSIRRLPHAGDWHRYPVVFVQDLSDDLPSDRQFKKQYGRAVAGLVKRNPAWKWLKPERVTSILAEDLSGDYQVSRFFSEGCAVTLYYASYRRRLIESAGSPIPGQEWAVDQFMVNTVAELVLIQQVMLHQLLATVRNLPASSADLQKFRRSILLGLDEYYEVRLISTHAQDLVDAGRKALRLDQSAQALNARLTLLDKTADVSESLTGC